MSIEEEVEDQLKQVTEDVVENDLLESDRQPEMKHESNAQEEKIERQAFSETGASMSPQQIEFLVRQKTSMDNDELEEFLSGEHRVHEKDRSWKPFSMTEEKFLLQNIQGSDIDEIAAQIDRDPEEVKMQVKIMGLEDQLM